ncbi:MAG: RecX family transcriptional regulator [Myxococcota bacterium]
MDQQRRPRKQRKPKKVSERYLTNVAKWYIERYVPCSGQLRRALMKRVNRGLAEHGGDREEALEWVEAVIARMTEIGAIDDEEYARAWARSYHNRGVALRDIRGRLRKKGLPEQIVDQTLTTLREEYEGDPVLAAACAYVRRRRFGPWRRDPDKRTARADKDLAAMARAGHRYDIAKRVLGCEDLDAFLEMEAKAQGHDEALPSFP